MIRGSQYFDDGAILARRGDHRAAFQSFSKGVRAGDVYCIGRLGSCYADGLGVRKDLNRARDLYRRAWREEKDSGYLMNIAMTYEEEGNRKRALYWWTRAWATGDGEAALGLAKHYLSSSVGLRVPRSKVHRLLRKAYRSDNMTKSSREEAAGLLAELGSG